MSFYELFWYFTLYAVLGWCLEVCFCTINTGSFVNRGFLNGPVCPIYGFGMVIILAVLLPVQGNLLALFLGAIVLTSLLELVTGFALKKLFHTSWWDYSDEPFNVGGYICLKFSLAWGLCAVAVVRVLHPLLAGLVALVPPVLGWALMIPVAVLFAADCAVTVAAILKLNHALGRIEELTQALHTGSEALAKTLGEGALAADDTLDGVKADLQARVDIARAELLDTRHAVQGRLLRAFPKMKHAQQEALHTVRTWLREEREERKPPRQK